MNKQTPVLKTCNKCRKNPRCQNPMMIYCEECFGKEQAEMLRFKIEMNNTPCPKCGVGIGIHAEYGLMKCLNEFNLPNDISSKRLTR